MTTIIKIKNRKDIMKPYFYSFLAAAMLLASPTYADDMLAEINAKAEKMRTLRAQLHSDDKDIRLATLDVMLKARDTELREVAYRETFAADDPDMVVVALKNKFNSLSQIAFTVDKSSVPDEKQMQLSVIQPTWTTTVSRYGEEGGDMQLSVHHSSSLSASRRNASISGKQFDFNLVFEGRLGFSCNGQTSYTSNATFEGQISCDNVVMPISFEVF